MFFFRIFQLNSSNERLFRIEARRENVIYLFM